MGTSRLPCGNSESLPRELTELLAAVRELPEPFRQRLEPIVQQVLENARRKRQVLTMVQEALAQLRLDMKYLVFDLEATRRERDAYRRLVEGNK